MSKYEVDPDVYSIVDGGLVFHIELDANECLDLEDCKDLKTLPESLKVGGFLDLQGCSSLVSLPDNLHVGGSLYLGGCSSLRSLPTDLHIDGALCLGGIDIDFETMTLGISLPIPESCKHMAVGKRIIDVVDHYLLQGHWLGDMIINGISEEGDFFICRPEDAELELAGKM